MMPNTTTLIGRLMNWLEERVGLSDFVALGRKKQVPLHRHTIWYYLGGMTLFLFILQVVSGILLLLYYHAVGFGQQIRLQAMQHRGDREVGCLG